MDELFAAVERLATLLPAVDPEQVESDQLGPALVRLSGLRDRLDAVRHRLTTEQARRTAWRMDGAQSQQQWLRDHCRLSAGAAAGHIRTARQLAELPATAAALADGTIGGGHAEVAARVARDLPDDALAGLDALVAQAGPRVDATELRKALDDYAQQVAPESLEEREQRAWRARRLSVTRSGDGAAVVDGRLDLAGGETVLTALAALSAPRAADDTRTPEQRRADALVELARRALDTGDLPEVGQVRPHVTVIVDLATLISDAAGGADLVHAPGSPASDAAGGADLVHTLGSPASDAAGRPAGPATPGSEAAGAAIAGSLGTRVGAPGGRGAAATLDRLGAVSAETARRIACDASVTRVVTGPGSQPLDVGRSARVVTVAQRRALAVRDRGCVGCAAPIAWTEAHHVRHWADGGRTDLANLVLLCWRCHRDVHGGGPEPVREPTGRWVLRSRPPP